MSNSNRIAGDGIIPLMVIDVCEHAFYINQHSRKAEYVEKFMDHID